MSDKDVDMNADGFPILEETRDEGTSDMAESMSDEEDEEAIVIKTFVQGEIPFFIENYLTGFLLFRETLG